MQMLTSSRDVHPDQGTKCANSSQCNKDYLILKNGKTLPRDQAFGSVNRCQISTNTVHDDLLSEGSANDASKCNGGDKDAQRLFFLQLNQFLQQVCPEGIE